MADTIRKRAMDWITGLGQLKVGLLCENAPWTWRSENLKIPAPDRKQLETVSRELLAGHGFEPFEVGRKEFVRERRGGMHEVCEVFLMPRRQDDPASCELLDAAKKGDGAAALALLDYVEEKYECELPPPVKLWANQLHLAETRKAVGEMVKRVKQFHVENLPKERSSRLDELTTQIKASHHAFEQALLTSLERGIELGGMLTEAKELVGHGNWQHWVDTELKGIGIRMVQKYMFLHRERGKLANANLNSLLSIDKAISALNASMYEIGYEHFTTETKEVDMVPGLLEDAAVVPETEDLRREFDQRRESDRRQELAVRELRQQSEKVINPIREAERERCHQIYLQQMAEQEQLAASAFSLQAAEERLLQTFAHAPWWWPRLLHHLYRPALLRVAQVLATQPEPEAEAEEDLAD